jgi:hypothetical protein
MILFRLEVSPFIPVFLETVFDVKFESFRIKSSRILGTEVRFEAS